jgi:NIMA (never in mitosis gene a)-related kinase
LGHGYSFLKAIGRGSFGEASLVQDREGKRYVMKTIDVSRLDHEHQREAGNEVKVLASLAHPYIVHFVECFIENGALAIVMDYAEGGDLGKLIERQRKLGEPFDEAQILRWFTQMALGLKYLHKQQIIHRDMKPSNVFLTREKDLRIGDFGISKMVGSKTAVVEDTIGTPYYISPEICTEKLYSFASDLWALGVIMFELVSLRVPFDAQNIPSLVKKITSGSVPQLPQSISADMRRLICGLLVQDHIARPTAENVLQTHIVRTEMHRMLREKHPETTPPLEAMRSRSKQHNHVVDESPRAGLQPQFQLPQAAIMRNISAQPGVCSDSPGLWSRGLRTPRPESAGRRRPTSVGPNIAPQHWPRQAVAMALPSGSPRRCHEKEAAFGRAQSAGGNMTPGRPNCLRSAIPNSRPPSAIHSRPPSGRPSRGRRSIGSTAFAHGGC